MEGGGRLWLNLTYGAAEKKQKKLYMKAVRWQQAESIATEIQEVLCESSALFMSSNNTMFDGINGHVYNGVRKSLAIKRNNDKLGDLIQRRILIHKIKGHPGL